MDVLAAVALLRERTFVALSGAGMSTDSGIPDYRGPNAPARMPMMYDEFVSSPASQQRYWARSHIGWSAMVHAVPNDGHVALADLEDGRSLQFLITQNVDGLHEAAGSRQLCTLHGRIADVICLSCHRRTARAELQSRLVELNPGWVAAHADAAVRPDGDVELNDTAGFVVPPCKVCAGALKPDVVFFGENVPRERVQRCYAEVDRAEALLVLGSSLTVMSGLRFVRRAAHNGIPVVIVNRGTTRGDPLATYKLDLGTTGFLTHLSAAVAAIAT